MKRPGPIPAVLPRASIVIGEDDRLTVHLDGAPFPVPAEWAGAGSAAIGPVMEAISVHVGRVVRVDVTWPDGTHLTEIITPADADELHHADRPPIPPATSVRASSGGSFLGVAEPGFRPGERVSIAVVVATSHAGLDGVAALRMPPGLLARKPFAMVLLGHDSGHLVVHDPHPDAGAA